MRLQLFLTLLGASSVFSAALPVVEERQTTCSAVHIIAARGSTQAASPGTGSMGTLAALITSSNTGTTTEAVSYPATLTNYASSSASGTAALKAQLTAYVTKCPSAKIVLLGYSQGAHIILDALCGGGGGSLGTATAAISTAIGDKVTAIVQYGDPRFIAGLSYDVGTATTNGIYPRLSTQSCSRYAAKIKSYCDAGDPFCASGSNLAVHSTYPSKYDNAALAFVNTLI